MNNYSKGNGVSIPRKPPLNASVKDHIRYHIIKAINEVSRLNQLTTTDLAKITGISKIRIQRFRFDYESNSRTSPKISELVKMYRAFNKREEYFPTGLHGRRFNYVQIFRNGEEFTEYEEELLQEIEQLKQKLETLKQKLPHV